MSASANFNSGTLAIYINRNELRDLVLDKRLLVPVRQTRSGPVILAVMVECLGPDHDVLAAVVQSFNVAVAEAKAVIPARPKGKPGRPKSRKE